MIAEKREDGRVMTEATIKIWVEGERFVRTAEGNGPVHALDRALRGLISRPIRTSPTSSSSTTRSASWTSQGDRRLVTRVAARRLRRHGHLGRDPGVHENVIEASWDALVDSLEAGMLPRRSGHRRGARTGTA